jgi:hypothetical protein
LHLGIFDQPQKSDFFDITLFIFCVKPSCLGPCRIYLKSSGT